MKKEYNSPSERLELLRQKAKQTQLTTVLKDDVQVIIYKIEDKEYNLTYNQIEFALIDIDRKNNYENPLAYLIAKKDFLSNVSVKMGKGNKVDIVINAQKDGQNDAVAVYLENFGFNRFVKLEREEESNEMEMLIETLLFEEIEVNDLIKLETFCNKSLKQAHQKEVDKAIKQNKKAQRRADIRKNYPFQF